MTELYRGLDLGAYHCVGASAPTTDAVFIGVDVNPLGNRSTPGVIAIEGKQRLAGEAAEGRTNANPTQTYNYLTPALLCKDDAELQAVKQRRGRRRRLPRQRMRRSSADNNRRIESRPVLCCSG